MRHETLNIWEGPNDWIDLDLRTDGALWGYRADAYFDGGSHDSHTSGLSHPTREAALRVGLQTLRTMIAYAHTDGSPPFLDELLKAHEPKPSHHLKRYLCIKQVLMKATELELEANIGCPIAFERCFLNLPIGISALKHEIKRRLRQANIEQLKEDLKLEALPDRPLYASLTAAAKTGHQTTLI